MEHGGIVIVNHDNSIDPLKYNSKYEIWFGVLRTIISISSGWWISRVKDYGSIMKRPLHRNGLIFRNYKYMFANEMGEVE